MMLYKNTKVKVRSPDGDTDYFDIVADGLQGDTLAPCLFVICRFYVLRTSIDLMKENGFTLAKERSRRYPSQTIMDADDDDDIAFLTNSPAQAESQLHSLEQAAGGIGLHVNADKTEFMYFNQRADISTLNGGSLKHMDKFTYLGSNVSSTENDINTRRVKAQTAIDRLSVIWKSVLSYKLKRSFSKQWSYQYCYMDEPRIRWLKVWRKSLTAITQECYKLYWTSPGSNTPQNSSCAVTNHSSRKPSELDGPNMRDTAGEVRTNS